VRVYIYLHTVKPALCDLTRGHWNMVT